MAERCGDMGEAIQRISGSYHRLVLLVGLPGSGKTARLRALAQQAGYPYININLTLSQRMLELTRTQRARQADRLMRELVAEAADVVVLDNLEILFDPTLQVEPLRLLQAVSRNRTIVAAWNGSYDGGILTYAEANHQEYREYRDVHAMIVVSGQDVATHP